MIIFKDKNIEAYKSYEKSGIINNLGIELISAENDSLTGKMPVDDRTKQPFGILHGGASIVLAETLGSIASGLLIDLNNYHAVGLEVNGNHIRPVDSGYVYGKAKAIHIGKKTHIWEIRITNDEGKLVCISRLTTAIIKK
ncbi:MAG: hotdog fold thioesterase [Flavobacteriales bacterium]|nr:hotdog fold thioesterase [Flavobacteriales bacterium]